MNTNKKINFKILNFILLSTLITSNLSATVLFSTNNQEKFEVYENLKVGDKIKKHKNNSWFIYKRKKEYTYQTFMPYVLYGKYKKNNSENKDWLITSGFYYSFYTSNLPNWKFTVDTEGTYINTTAGNDIKEIDLTLGASKYIPIGRVGENLTIHFTKDNTQDTAYAIQYRLNKYITKYSNGKYKTLVPYTKLAIERYRFLDNNGNERNNMLFSVKPGFNYTIPVKNYYLTTGIEYRLTKQSGSKNKFLYSDKEYMQGIKLNLILNNNKNIFNISTYFGDEIGTIDNEGYVIYDTTEKQKNYLKLKYTRILNKTLTLSVQYDIDNYKILRTDENSYLHTYLISLSKSF